MILQYICFSVAGQTFCYCENKNGGPEENKIICENNLAIVNTTACESTEGCTGTTNRSNGVLYSPPDISMQTVTKHLCRKGSFASINFTVFTD